MVKEMMSEFKQKSKSNFIVDGPSQAENNGMERKRLREEQRDELLLSTLLDGTRMATRGVTLSRFYPRFSSQLPRGF